MAQYPAVKLDAHMEETRRPRRQSSVQSHVPRLYHEEIAQTWETARTRAGTLAHRDFSLAGHPFRLTFAGDTLVPRIVPALEHLSVPSVPSVPVPELIIHLWDDASLRTDVPMPDDLMRQQYRHHQLHSCCNERYLAFHEEWIGTLSLFDREKRSAYYCCLDAGSLPLYESTAPLRAILGHWLNLFSLQIVHAAAVGTGAGALLLAGPGGSGKSSTAVLALQHGFQYLADDLCVIASQPDPTVYSLYNTVKLRTGQIERFGPLTGRMRRYQECDEEKAILFLHTEEPRNLCLSAQVRALLLPRLEGKPETTLARSNWSRALRGLAPWSLLQVPGSERKSVDLMFRFVSRLPTYDLALGTDLSSISPVLHRLLAPTRPA